MAEMNQIPVTVVQPGEGEYVALPGFGAVFRPTNTGRPTVRRTGWTTSGSNPGRTRPRTDQGPARLVSPRFGGLAGIR